MPVKWPISLPVASGSVRYGTCFWFPNEDERVDLRLKTDHCDDGRVKENTSADTGKFVNQATDENGRDCFDDQSSREQGAGHLTE